MKKFWYFTCVALFVYVAHSCDNPELIDDVSTIGFNGVDTTTIKVNEDLESYMTGKCIMVSFEKQVYSIPYTQLTVDTAFTDVDWITVTRHSTYVKVTISENYSPEYRNGYAYYRLKGAEKFDTVIVSQGPRDMFFVEKVGNTGYILDNKMHEVYFDVFSNVEYTIEIPDSAKEWIQLITPKNTRAYFKDSNFGVIVQPNEGSYRETYISLKSEKSNERQSIRISQDGQYFTLDRLVARNPNLTIFYQAIEATGLSETLQQYLDYSYPEIGYEWTEQALRDNYYGIHYYQTPYEKDYITVPEKREFKYTLFCMPDTALAAYSDNYWSGGIHNLNELRQYADKVYPEGAGQPDTDKSSSLYKLIAYHILPCWLVEAHL